LSGRSLPGVVGRGRAGHPVGLGGAELDTSQVGRARADLQYRLAEATRKLVRVVEQRYADGTERMSSALRAAAELRQASDQEAARQLTYLDRREAELRQALSLLAPEGDGSHNGSGDEARRNRGAMPH
jgi:hypothetical protein